MSTLNVEDLDVYEILKLPDDCSSQDIKRAYRKAALVCHPDKRPDDPVAAKQFLQLGAILKLLLEPHSRNAYDALRRARLQARIRLEKQDSVRKKLREDLERRERESAKVDTRSDEQKLKATIERLRKESSRQLEEEIAAMQRVINLEIQKEMATMQRAESRRETHRLKLKWKRSKTDPGYNYQTLEQIFSKYGEVTALVVSRKGGSALLEYESFMAADDAVENERGFPSNPIEVAWVSGQPTTSNHPPASSSHNPHNTSIPPEEEGLDFEELVLSRLTAAQREKDSAGSAPL